MMAGPQHLRHLHIQHTSHDSASFPAHISPTVHSPTFMRNTRKPLSPANSTSSDFDNAALEKIAAADASDNLQHYPIRSGRPGHDPLVSGLSKIGHELGSTLLPMLSVPAPKGPENVGNPHCRGVKGIGGPMVSTAPVQAVYNALSASKQQQQQPNQQGQQHPQQTQQYRVQKQQQQQQDSPAMPHYQPQQYNYDTPAYTPSPPSARSPIQTSKPPPSSNPGSVASDPPRSQPSPSHGQPKQPKKEPQQEFKTEFRFVVNEDAKTARNTVRQHVMREFRRRERWEQGKNKVSKSKKPKKEPKEPVKPEQSHAAAKRTSSPSSTVVDGSLPDATSDSQRRNSQAMSISGSSESSNADADRFTSLLAEKTLSYKHRPHPNVQPFAQYVDNGLGLKPEDVEEAVEEIERSELSLLPYQYDPWAEIAKAEINPFSSQVSVGAGPASRALLHHYAWVMPSLMDEIVTGNVFHRIGWLYSAVAIHDPTPYYTIMGFTLAHVAMLRGMPEPAMAIEHKEKSLQLIHNRLANPLVAASDGSIGAIANIAAYELIDCRPEKFAIHMQGLARLITQRGGMSDFALNPELELVLIRLDAIRSYVNISAPRYAAWAAVRSLTPLAINIGPPSTDWFCPPAEFHAQQYLFAEDAIRLVHNVEDVLSMMRSVHPTIPFTPDPSFKSLLRDSVVHHLRRDTMDTPGFFRSHVSRRVLRMAALVMIDIAAAEFFNSPQVASGPGNAMPASPHSTASGPTRSPSQALTRSFPGPSPPQTSELNQPIPERSPGSANAPTDRKGLGQKRLRDRFPAIEHYRHQWGRSVEMIFAVLMQAERMALERPFRAWYVADVVTMTMKLGDGDWEAIEQVLRTDLVRRILEERHDKEERARRGTQEDSAWDFEDVLTQFWQEWSDD